MFRRIGAGDAPFFIVSTRKNLVRAALQLQNSKVHQRASTGESSRNEASLVVAGWLFDGIPKPWSNKRYAVGGPSKLTRQNRKT